LLPFAPNESDKWARVNQTPDFSTHAENIQEVEDINHHGHGISILPWRGGLTNLVCSRNTPLDLTRHYGSIVIDSARDPDCGTFADYRSCSSRAKLPITTFT